MEDKFEKWADKLGIVLKRSLLSVILTILIAGIGTVISGSRPYNCDAFNAFVFGAFLGGLFFSIPNLILLLLLYFTKISQEFFLQKKWMVVETLLLFGSSVIEHLIVRKLIDYLPIQYVFYKTATEEGRRFYFTDAFEFIYTFLILLIFLFITKKLFIRSRN